MKKSIFLIVSLMLVTGLYSQLIVKMTVPPQAQEPLQVAVLFDEEVPEGMPVVLGLMGYRVKGGMQPYTYQWLQNGELIGTGDIVVITPKKGDSFELKALDKNRCYSTMAFTMKVIARIDAPDNASDYKVYPTVITDSKMNISIPDHKEGGKQQATVRLFSVQGKMVFHTSITGSSVISCALPEGTYFISVQTDTYNHIEKIIYNH